MNGRKLVAFAIVAAVLVATAPIAGVSAWTGTQLVAGSEHTTASDFSGASTTNTTIKGSGSDAYVQGLAENSTLVDFEDGNINGWTGDTGAFAADDSRAANGSWSMRFDGTTSAQFVDHAISDAANTSYVAFSLNVDEHTTGPHPLHQVIGPSGNFGPYVRTSADGSLIYADGFNNFVDSGVDLAADTWYRVELVDIDTDSDTYSLRVRDASGAQLFAVWDVDMREAISAPDTFRTAGNTDVFWIDDIKTGSRHTSATYESDEHTVEDAQEARVDLTLRNATADITVEDLDGNTLAQQTGISSSGLQTLSLSGQTNSDIRTTVEFDNQSGPSLGRIHDESIWFTATAPTVDNGSASPTGQLTSSGPTLSIDVKDADFPLAQSDELTLEWHVDGSLQGTTTETSNGTATFSLGSISGGSHTWHVEVTDDYGGEATSQTFSFSTPDQLNIYNETRPSSLVSTNTDITVQFFAENGSVYERTTQSGTIDFGGLPVDQSFVVSASANGYHDRRIYIESLLEQQDIYLLNETIASSNVVFSLNDNSQQFTPPDESVLFVEKALTKSGDTRYRVITSDLFSATTEVPVTLQTDQRYRLRLLSTTSGATRVLGAYRATGDDAATLTVGSVTFEGDSASNPHFSSSISEVSGQRILRIAYRDPANATTGLTLKVTNRSDGSVIRPETTESGPFGRYVETIPIASSKENIAFNVTYDAQRTGYDDVSGQEIVGDLPKIAQQLGIAPSILSMLGYLTILGVLGITCISYPRYAGIPTVAIAIGLVTLGVLSIHPLLLGGAGVIALVFAAGGER